MLDMKDKGRARNRPTSGERNPAAKVTEDDVRKIRQLGALKVPQRVIGEMFSIDQTTVSLIVNRKKWQHID